jgi:cytochrome oxidase Cu insertion factor (SCO1/SenC/PrrC family)
MIKIEENSTEYLNQQHRGRMMLLSMLIFFIIPVIAVFLMYKLDWRPQGESIGELVTPPRAIKLDQALTNSDGVALNKPLLQDKWSMVYVTSNCEFACQTKLHQMRQLHVSLYKEIPRMRRVLITTSLQITEIKQQHPELQIINQPATAVTALSEQFNLNHASSIDSDRIYLIDPLGNLIMSYQPSTEPAMIRKDITRLMKYSWAG